MSGNPTVVVRNVSRIYRADNKRSIFTSRRRRSSSAPDSKIVTALDGVNLVAEQGESIGVLGRNGSGKSTLMRLIAGNEVPNCGEVFTSSTPTLLNVSAALQPRLSGVDNIKLGLLAQGVPRSQLPELTAEIIDFADIGNAINRPMATYSSGMGARLKFAISTAVRREILLVDEALGTGDASFTERAQERMQSFRESAGTIFLVSHSAAEIQRQCNRAIWLHEGRVIADAPAELVTLLYRKWTARIARNNHDIADSLIRNVENVYQAPTIVLRSELDRYFPAS